MELRADEKNNKADVEIFLRKIAKQHISGEVNMSDIEADVLRSMGINLTGKLLPLQEEMNLSLRIYRAALRKLEALPGFAELLRHEDLRPDAVQETDDFNMV